MNKDIITSMCGKDCRACFPKLSVLESAAGFYIGRWNNGPHCRVTGYFESRKEAESALARVRK